MESQQPFKFYNLRTPYFSKAQLEQIHRYAYIMGYTFEIKVEEYSVLNGKSHILWNEDKSNHVFLQSGKDGVVNTIYKSFKTCLTDCLICAELLLIKNGRSSAFRKNLVEEKKTNLNVNERLFSAARELYDIDTFVIKRQKQNELLNHKGQDIQCNNREVSGVKNVIQTSTT